MHFGVRVEGAGCALTGDSGLCVQATLGFRDSGLGLRVIRGSTVCSTRRGGFTGRKNLLEPFPLLGRHKPRTFMLLDARSMPTAYLEHTVIYPHVLYVSC